MTRTLDLSFKELVIGADLSALIYAYNNKIPLIYIKHAKPYLYEDEKKYENNLNLWENLMFSLALNGLCPFDEKVQSIRLEEENLKVTTKGNYLVNIKFDNLVLSDDYKVEGLPRIIGKTNHDNVVMDFLCISQRKPEQTQIESSEKDSKILKEINFTGKYVVDRKHTLVICKSILSDSEIISDDYSESYMRLRFLREMHPKIKETRHLRREIKPLGKNIYEPADKLEFLYDNPEKLLTDDCIEDAYFSLIEKKLKWKKQ